MLGIYRDTEKSKWKLLYSILGIYRDNGEETGNYYIACWGKLGGGVYRDNGEESGN